MLVPADDPLTGVSCSSVRAGCLSHLPGDTNVKCDVSLPCLLLYLHGLLPKRLGHEQPALEHHPAGMLSCAKTTGLATQPLAVPLLQAAVIWGHICVP